MERTKYILSIKNFQRVIEINRLQWENASYGHVFILVLRNVSSNIHAEH